MDQYDFQDYNLLKPWLKDGRWLVFPDAVFSGLDSTDCNDTVNGTCITGKDLNSCIQTCQDSPEGECKAGYFISGGNEDICVPIKTNIHSHLNPAFRLRRKRIYPVMKNLTVNTFIDIQKYKFPPNMANAVFYQDFFILSNTSSELKIKLPPDNLVDITNVELTKDKGMNLQLLPYKSTMEKNEIYIPYRYGEPAIVNIPGTNLVMVKHDNNSIGWLAQVLASPDIHNTFTVHSTSSKDGEIAFYGDDVYIMYQGLYILEYNENLGLIKGIYETYETARNKGRNVLFKFSPNIEAYYCNGWYCSPVPLKETKADHLSASYKGTQVSRNPDCWAMCDALGEIDSTTPPNKIYSSHPEGKGKKILLYLILLLPAIVIILILLFYSLYRP